jgi:transcriptional regulator with XRE-family HTH domain
MDSGKWIRELREERSVKPTDIERISRTIAESKGDSDFYVSHSTLADIETGSVPSVHKLFSLAVCLRVSLNELLSVFGADPEEIARYSAQTGPGITQLQPIDLREPRFRFQLNFDTRFHAEETSLLKLDNPERLAALPATLQARLDPRRYRYAMIGLEDDSMGDLIPPGSLVEIDTKQNTIQVSQWRTLRERPVYLVWHADGHTCCWCQLEGKDLTLVPYPLSRRPARRFKVPGEASVIGRVVNAWLPFDESHLRIQAS